MYICFALTRAVETLGDINGTVFTSLPDMLILPTLSALASG